MKNTDFLEVKLSACQRVLELTKSELSGSKEKERILQKKLDNASETIRCLNKKLEEKKEKDVCIWEREYMLYEEKYETLCGHSLYLLDGEFIDRGYKKCPYCGRRLIIEDKKINK